MARDKVGEVDVRGGEERKLKKGVMNGKTGAGIQMAKTD